MPALLPLLSNRGKVAATLQASGTIHVSDLAAGKPLLAFKNSNRNPLLRNSPGQLIALTPDGKQLVLPHKDGSIHLMDVTWGKEVLAFDMPRLKRRGARGIGPPQQVAVSPDGRYLAYAGLQNVATLCDLKTGKRLRELGPGRVGITGLDFAPNSRLLAVRGHSDVRVFGIVSGKELRHFAKPFGSNGTVAFSPDGRTLAALGGSTTIPLWDVLEDRLVHLVVGHQSPLQALAFFPDGKRLASAGRTDGLIVWDIGTGRDRAHKRTNFRFSTAFTVGGDGVTLQYFGLDQAIHRWNPESGDEELQPIPRIGSISKFTPSPDGRSVVGISSTYPPRVALYDLHERTAQALPFIQEHFRTTRITPTAERLAQLIADLDADSFQVREHATRALAEVGSKAADALRMARMKGPSPEKKRRIDNLLAQVDKRVDPERLRSLRAIEVLERIGTPQARQTLAELGNKDIDPDLREEIHASLRRLERPDTAADNAGQRRDAACPD